MMGMRMRGRNVDGGFEDYAELKDYTGGIYAKQFNPEKKLVDEQSVFDGNSLIDIIQKGFYMASQPLLATQQVEKILSKGNLYSTERDIVSSGYKGSKLQNLIGTRPEIIENKDYVRDIFEQIDWSKYVSNMGAPNVGGKSLVVKAYNDKKCDLNIKD